MLSQQENIDPNCYYFCIEINDSKYKFLVDKKQKTIIIKKQKDLKKLNNLLIEWYKQTDINKTNKLDYLFPILQKLNPMNLYTWYTKAPPLFQFVIFDHYQNSKFDIIKQDNEFSLADTNDKKLLQKTLDEFMQSQKTQTDNDYEILKNKVFLKFVRARIFIRCNSDVFVNWLGNQKSARN